MWTSAINKQDGAAIILYWHSIKWYVHNCKNRIVVLASLVSNSPVNDISDVPGSVGEEREGHEVEAYSEESDTDPELLEKERGSYDHKQSRGKGGSECTNTTALKEDIHGSLESSSSKRESAITADIAGTADHDKNSKMHLHVSQQSSDHEKSTIADVHGQVSSIDSGEHGVQVESCSKTAEGTSALQTDTTSMSELEMFEFPQSESSHGHASDQEIVASVPSESREKSNKKSSVHDSELPLPSSSPLEHPSITTDSQRNEGSSIGEEDKSIVFAAFLDTAQLNSKLGISFQRESRIGDPVSETLPVATSPSELEAAQHCVSPSSITFGSFSQETDLSGLLEEGSKATDTHSINPGLKTEPSYSETPPSTNLPSLAQSNPGALVFLLKNLVFQVGALPMV